MMTQKGKRAAYTVEFNLGAVRLVKAVTPKVLNMPEPTLGNRVRLAANAGCNGEYGCPRIWKELRSRGGRAGKGRIQKLMKLHGIKASGKRRHMVTTDSKQNLPLRPIRWIVTSSPSSPTPCGPVTLPTEGWLHLAAAPGRCN